MLRTLEALFVVILVFGTFYSILGYTTLPAPVETSSIGLRELADSTLVTLDKDGYLSYNLFKGGDTGWVNVIKTIDSTMPTGLVYQLTEYETILDSTTGQLEYNPLRTAGSADGNLPPGSVTATYRVTSPDVTVTQTPQKIGKTNPDGSISPITLYILDIDQANGWWITGYDGHNLALNANSTLSPYFETTVMVKTMADYQKLLNGNKLTSDPNESVQNAIIINPFGEVVPIPQTWNDVTFTFDLGHRVNIYNWTWVSMVGYPLYYESNTARYSSGDNGWGIYGEKSLGPQGLDSFLNGLDGNPSYTTPSSTFQAQDIGVVSFNSTMYRSMNYYGVYPGAGQTSSRAFPSSYLTTTHKLKLRLSCFDKKPSYPGLIAAGLFSHYNGAIIQGSLLIVGLARTPDARVTQLMLLSLFNPQIYRTEFSVQGTNRLVSLQIGQVGTN